MNKIFILFGVNLFFVLFILINNGSAQSIDPLIDTPGNTIGSDFNGDGIQDFIVGADGNDDGPGSNGGASYIFFGANNLSSTQDLGRGQSADVTVLGKAANDHLGISVSSAADLNGDGIDDIIVGAYRNAGGGNYAGAAYIFFGAGNLSGTKSLGETQSADVTILGKAAYDKLSRSVSGLGDVNGDGFDDMIAGAYGNDDVGSYAGAAYIFFGAGNLSGTKSLGGVESADVTILAKVGTDRLGNSVSGAGDLNGDGFDDIIVGAPRHDSDDGAGTDDEGAAYIFYGSSTLSGTKSLGGAQSADVTVIGKAGADHLGRSVSGLGDVNGDGFDDIIVGAYNNDDGPGNDAGAAYIFFGASNLSGTKDLSGVQSADMTILGKAGSDLLGFSVSGAGDVNDDGFDDIIVGARGNADGGATNEGAAYIFFGSTTLSGTKSLGEGQSADVTVLGEETTSLLGTSVSGIGDINTDGIPDIIVGARQNDDGTGSNAGAAYIFFGATNLSGTKDTGASDENIGILGKADSDNLGVSVGGGRNNPGP